MRANKIACVLLAVSGLAAGKAAIAHENDDGWHFLIEPYVMFPNMKGDIGIGVLPPAHVDEGPDDIFSNLQMGVMLYAEAYNSRWAFSSDVLYMYLKSDVAAGAVITGGEARAKQLGWEIAALGRLSPWIELGVSATYNRLDSNVRIDTANTSRSAGITKDWIDPSMLMRATVPLGEKWFLQGRLNVGGFGVGSRAFYQGQADIGYRHSDRFLLTVGYRYISVDYEDGSGANRFVYDVDSFGPTMKFGFTF